MRLQQAPLALRCLRPRLQSGRRRFRALRAVFPTKGGLWVAKAHLGHARGTETRLGGSVEATFHALPRLIATK